MYSKQFCQRAARLGGKNSGTKKSMVFLESTTQQLFAKLKQEANLERTKARGAVQAKKSIR